MIALKPLTSRPVNLLSSAFLGVGCGDLPHLIAE